MGSEKVGMFVFFLIRKNEEEQYMILVENFEEIHHICMAKKLPSLRLIPGRSWMQSPELLSSSTPCAINFAPAVTYISYICLRGVSVVLIILRNFLSWLFPKGIIIFEPRISFGNYYRRVDTFVTVTDFTVNGLSGPVEFGNPWIVSPAYVIVGTVH